MENVAIPVQLSVVIIVERGGRFLMIEEDRGPDIGDVWYFPSGAVEPGESLVDAGRREVIEEAGVLANPTHLLQIDHGWFRGYERLTWWRCVLVARFQDDNHLRVDSGGQVAWLALDDLAGRRLRALDATALIERLRREGPGLPIERVSFSESGELEGFFH